MYLKGECSSIIGEYFFVLWKKMLVTQTVKKILEHKNKPALFQVRTYNWGCSYKVERQYMNYGRGLLFCYGSIMSALSKEKIDRS